MQQLGLGLPLWLPATGNVSPLSMTFPAEHTSLVYCTHYTVINAHYTLNTSNYGHKTAHYTLNTAHCKFNNEHCSLYTIHCIMYTQHCTLYTHHCILHTQHCTLNTAHCTLKPAHYPHRTYICTMNFVLPTTHCKLLTKSCSLRITHRTLNCAKGTLITWHCLVYTAHCTHVHGPLHTEQFTVQTLYCPLYTHRTHSTNPSKLRCTTISGHYQCEEISYFAFTCTQLSLAPNLFDRVLKYFGALTMVRK